MITERQKTITEQAVYGDLMGCDLNKVEAIKPILRPLSDLTKTITHNGYNDDQPFVPLIKLAKINFMLRPQDDSDYTIQNGDYGYGIYFNHKSYRGRARCFFLQVYKNGTLQAFSTDARSHSDKSNTAKHCGLNAKKIIDLLHLWHFDTRGLISQGEAVDANSIEKNPYEI